MRVRKAVCVWGGGGGGRGGRRERREEREEGEEGGEGRGEGGVEECEARGVPVSGRSG